MGDKLAQNLESRLKKLEQQAIDYRGVHKDIRDAVMPNRGFFPDDGDNVDQIRARYRYLIDPIAHDAALVLASGMQSGLTNKNRPWFEISLEDKDLAEFKPVQLWLEECTKRLRMAMLQTNFYLATFQAYQDMASFGVHAQVADEGEKAVIVHRNCPVGTYVIAEGPDGVVETLFRIISLSASVIVRRWGKRASRSTRDLAKEPSTADKPITVVQAIFPRDDTALDSPFASDKMEYASVYYERDSQAVLERGGYYEKPVLVPRWDTNAQNPWGEGPGNYAVGLSRMLQAMQRASLKQVQMVGDPPVVAPSYLKGRVKLIPAGVTWSQGMGKDEGLRPLYQVNPNIEAMEGKIAGIQTAIRRAFFNDFFLMISAKPKMTATEVMQRSQEKMLLLGPVIDRTQQEFLDPLVHRYFSVMMRNGMLPEPPEEVAGSNYVIDYVSLLAQAQKLQDVEAITSVAAYGGQLAQLNPQVLDVLSLEDSLREYAERRNVPASMLRTKDEVEQIRQARAEQAKEQERLAKIENMERMAKAGAGAAKAAKDLSETNIQDPSALTALLGQNAEQQPVEGA